MEKVYKIDSPHIETVREVAILTGKNGTTNTLEKYNIGGTDLGIPYYDNKRKEMFFLFGDSFSSTNKIGDDWRSQTVGISKTMNPEKGIVFDRFITDATGMAKEIIFSRKKTSEEDIEVTCIPTGGIAIDGIHYVFYMSIKRWIPGVGWKVSYNGIAKSTDAQNFEKINSVFFTVDDIDNTVDFLKVSKEEAQKRIAPNMGQVFPYEKGQYIYLYGIPGGRKGSVKLARVLKENIENQDEYEYYTKGSFHKGYEGLKQFNEDDSNYIAGPYVGELSIGYNKYLKKYLMMYLHNPEFSRETPGIVMRMSDDLINWSEEESIINYYYYYKLYGAFMNDLYQSSDGKKMYFIMSQWVSPKEEDYGYNSKVMEITFK